MYGWYLTDDSYIVCSITRRNTMQYNISDGIYGEKHVIFKLDFFVIWPSWVTGPAQALT